VSLSYFGTLLISLVPILFLWSNSFM
jgi:hypothetical protein